MPLCHSWSLHRGDEALDGIGGASFLLSLIKDAISFLVQLNTEWAQVEVINLINDGSGLGFGIIGGRSTGVVVKTILPGGVADRVSKSSTDECVRSIEKSASAFSKWHYYTRVTRTNNVDDVLLCAE